MLTTGNRYFNTSGQNIKAEHYTLDRAELVAKGRLFVHRGRYFTIWAPRQTPLSKISNPQIC